jgi:hypothetical protein
MLTNSDQPPKDAASRFTTGEVLRHEFELIHGAQYWDPQEPALRRDGEPVMSRDQLLENAESHVKRHDEASRREARRLALYAWSIANLPGPGQAALCLSGGGIRSAAFALGILQGLARRDLLRQFHYLSTVSGGGYIGSWLTAWRHRSGSGGDALLRRLGTRDFGEFTEPTPMERLRFNQNFLTPKVGLLSADTWSFLATFLRNLLLNWLVFLPLLAGLLLVPRIIEAFLLWSQQSGGNKAPHSSLIALFLAGHLWVPHSGSEHLFRLHDLHGWRSWADTAAVALILFGFSISAYNRPANGRTSLTQTGYMLWVVAPTFSGALLLTAAVAARLDTLRGSSGELLRWAYFGAIVYVMARLIAAVFALRRCAQVEAHHKKVFGLELLGWAAAGTCTGALVGFGAELCRMLPRELLGTYLAVYGPPWILSAFLVGEAIYAGLASRLPYGERDREWLARTGGWFGIVAVSYLTFSWLVLIGWQWLKQAGVGVHVAVGGSGLLSLLGALTPLTRATAASAAKQMLPVTGIVTALAGVFILGAAAGLAEASREVLGPLARFLHDSLGLWAISELPDPSFAPRSELLFVATSCVVLLLLSAVMSFFVNVNLFSLHALYRNRLVRTFLGASNVKETREAEGRNAFDGFSERDNLAIAELCENLRAGQVSLYPVLNMALNVLATKNLAWQQRKAEAFVCTPYFTGGDRVQYRHSALYSAGWWGDPDHPERGISLGTAMAISGAAVSPNWGYHSSPVTSFLMMLFNVRLGWWLGNPRHHKTWRYRGPRFGWRLFVQEALGWTDDREPWIYLSDGGHFENLGIYEMIRRRCRVIVVSDAGADPRCTLEDLGNAVRKIAIDFGVKIEFRRIFVRRRSDAAAAGVYCAVGEIRYPEGRDGQIIYLKPGFYGAGEPADVRAYAAANARFPHESTLNQWFGESQFESYRSLGAYVIDEVCRDAAPQLGLAQFAARVRQHLAQFEESSVSEGATLVEIRRRSTTGRGFGFSRRRGAA